jgi:hypothetical protein
MVTPGCTAVQNGHCWHLQNLQWLLARVGLQKSAHVLNVKSPRRPDWHATFSGSAAIVANGRRAHSKAARRRREADGFGRGRIAALRSVVRTPAVSLLSTLVYFQLSCRPGLTQRRALQQEHYSTRTVNATSEYSRKFGEDILEVAGLSRVKPFLSDLTALSRSWVNDSTGYQITEDDKRS